MHGKTRLGGEKMAVIANWITLLQSTGNSVLSDTLFVMLRCLVSKPFNTKLSIRYWDWRLLEQTVVFWHSVKLSGADLVWHLLCFIWLYCSLHIILLQMMYDLLCLDDRSRILSTQNVSLNMVQFVLSQHTTCLMSTLPAVSSRRAQDWGNNVRLRSWVSSSSIVVSEEAK